MTQLPEVVAAAIDAAAADANRKAVRTNSRELTDKLKRMTRTKHRGGTHPNFHDEPLDHKVVRSLRGKLRQQEHRALTELTQHASRLIEDDKALPDSFWDGQERPVTKFLDAMASEVRESASAQAAAGGALYNESSAIAYAASRMPAGYAALHRVLLELQSAAPVGWRPESILDFGAGPGTATWAAHSIWSKSGMPPLQVTAVEPSGAMAWLGQAIQQRLRDTYEDVMQKINNKNSGGGGKILNMNDFGPEIVRTFGNKDRDNNITASSIGVDTIDVDSKQDSIDSSFNGADSSTLSREEKEEKSDHNDLVEDLPPPPPAIRWMTRMSSQRGGHSSDRRNNSSISSGRKYEVVVAGYVLGEVATIRERRNLLNNLWRRTGKYLVLVEPGTPAGADIIHTARAQILASPAGSGTAHVTAPCPHDGACPLRGRPSWCHFVQRFERPAVLRSAKMLAGKKPPRSHQDEKFSYIVLAKGPRSKPLPNVRVAGAFPPEEGDLSSEYINIPEGIQAKNIGFQATREDVGEGYSSYSSDDGKDFSREGEDIEEFLEDDSDSDEDQEGEEEGVMTISDEEESESELESMGGTTDQDAAVEDQIRQMMLDSLDEEILEDGKLPPELEEVIQRAMEDMKKNKKKNTDSGAGADAGTDARGNNNELENDDFEMSTSGSESESEDEREENNRHRNEGVVQSEIEIFKNGTSIQSGRRKSRHSKKKEDLALLGYGADGSEAEAATKEESATWSRLLRQPRKRSGHVMVDMCSAVDAQGTFLGGNQGVILRQIVSKGKAARETGGIAPFKLARRVRWGDVWPMHYQNAMKTFEPPTGLDEN